ncbi:hypothetical protein VNO78_10964 [Psophocarpus tetragonolobus]|uniref:X8 domain-containing protein n=1 Tax=Psophocarpus tetragonolobus TaxID=3891 RepID=A0AAN9XN75_PSOTE
MAKSTSSLVFLFIFLLFLYFCFNLGNEIQELDQINSWCIAKPSASDVALINNIEYACNALGDCSIIQPGGPCFNPNNLLNHASVVMNQYYAANGRNTWNCYFSWSGIIVFSDPSFGSCTYA